MTVQDDLATAAPSPPAVRGAPTPNLPVPVQRPPRENARRGLHRANLLFIPLAIAVGAWWWFHSGPALPPGFASGNGRLEADEVDIDTKFAGRILELRADEGDLVKTGQVLAVMDTRDLQAQLKQYQQLVLEAQHTLDEAKANYAQQQAVVKFAQQEVERTSYLAPRGYATQETLDQQKQQLDSANATLRADEAHVAAAERAVKACRRGWRTSRDSRRQRISFRLPRPSSTAEPAFRWCGDNSSKWRCSAACSSAWHCCGSARSPARPRDPLCRLPSVTGKCRRQMLRPLI